MTFGPATAAQGWDVEKDDGSGAYSGPHWQDSPERRYPFLYKAGATMKIVSAKWDVESPNPGSTYKVKGTGPSIGGSVLEIPETTATLTGSVLTISNVAATVGFESSKVRFFDTFNIVWQVKVDSDPYESAGTSQNPIYVCLRGPDGSGKPIPFRTIVHVACASDGAVNAREAVDNSWGRLEGPSNLKGWNEETQAWSRPLFYYEPGTTFDENPGGLTALLLYFGRGQCGAWRDLMYDAIRLNGASADFIKVTSVLEDYEFGFLVKDWDPETWTGEYTFEFGGSDFDMIPVPTGDLYGLFINQTTIPGQNSNYNPPPDPPEARAPSQKAFNNHQILEYCPGGGYPCAYYDPSYGKKYWGAIGFQINAVGGFFADVGVEEGLYTLKVVEPPDPFVVLGVHFEPFDPPY